VTQPPPAFSDLGMALNPMVSAFAAPRFSAAPEADECLVHLELSADGAPDGEPIRLQGTARGVLDQVDELTGKGELPEGTVEVVEDALRRFKRRSFAAAGNGAVEFDGCARVMGIVNVTPDSFSDGGEHFAPSAAIARGEEMAAVGADMIDVGGESTRPGADPVSEQEELRRVLPVVAALVRRVTVPVSIDTRKARVAKAVLEAGASMVNDVSALRDDEAMAGVVAENRCPVVLMHMLRSPKTMQDDPSYGDVVRDVLDFLRRRARAALDAGIGEEQIIVDPGFGFGKTADHNLLLTRHLGVLKSLGLPVMLGASRKSTVGKVLDRPVDERLFGSLALAAWAVMERADVIRVHDVAETVQVVRMCEALRQGTCPAQ